MSEIVPDYLGGGRLSADEEAEVVLSTDTKPYEEAKVVFSTDTKPYEEGADNEKD